MRAIFISYRREDAEGQAGRLFNDLARYFGEDSVFMDVAGIEPGRDFRRVIDEHVASCGVLLAMIGKTWIDATDESGRRRLEDPMDFVRLETASALKRDIPVVPVLVHGARMPRAEQLPEDLAELAYRNGVELTHARWDSDVQVLIKALSSYVESLQKNAGEVNTSTPTRGTEPNADDKYRVRFQCTAQHRHRAARSCALGEKIFHHDRRSISGGGSYRCRWIRMVPKIFRARRGDAASGTTGGNKKEGRCRGARSQETGRREGCCGRA